MSTNQAVIDALKPAVERYRYFGRDAYVNDAGVSWDECKRRPLIQIPRSSVFYEALIQTTARWGERQDWMDCVEASWPIEEGTKPLRPEYEVTVKLPAPLWNYVGETLAYRSATNEWASVEDTIVEVLQSIYDMDRETPER